jgi:hypothetical protein
LETDRGVSWTDAEEMLKEQQTHASEMMFADNERCDTSMLCVSLD